jgi:hypothetical protein
VVDAPERRESRPDRLVTVVRRSDCSHGLLAMSAIKELAGAIGIPILVEDVLVETDEDARAHFCLGSPTVLVGSQDVEPAARGRAYFGVT